MRVVLLTIIIFFTFISKAFSYSLWQLELPETARKTSQHNWGGLYAGVNLGGQLGRSSDETGDFGYNADNDNWNYHQSGLNVGADVGYGFPVHGLVIGPEFELGYLGMKGNGSQPASPAGDTVGKSNSDFYTALRARVGVDLGNNLLFVSGGAMGVNYTTQVVDYCSVAPCGGGTINAYHKSFDWGYTVGGGVEHLFQKNWSVKIEYLYFDLNNQSINGSTNFGNSYHWTGQTYGNIIRGGLNYYF